ncbi:thrombospondin type 3 repeat-containing protein [Catellatospora vulcania]|uniref:thrombospondin type 3 repeat-containing protein n=1 Tax=Catellatospora vulcania TaxID=1460450 RepID=UPI0012D39043|nr:thrombospondin type 3 repeat-containing protein [Catellatospora vulcania]
MSRRILSIGAATVLCSVLAMGGGVPAGAAEQPRREHRVLRLCDPTGCYVAWRVYDSDRDGVCDADEVAAGTDPHDPASRPPLRLVAELAAGRALPSFEYGLGGFAVFPAEILAARQKLGVDPLGAFPLPSRADTLSRLGVSAKTLDEYGISIERDGFSLGLDGLTAKPGLPAGIKLGRFDASLVSAGAADPHFAHGGWIGAEQVGDGDTINRYRDGSTEQVTRVDGNLRIEFRDAQKDLTGTREGTEDTRVDGAAAVNSMRGRDVEPDGDTASTYYGESRGALDGTDDGSSEGTDYPDDEGGYVDPDQAYGAIVTQEMVDGVLRLRGASVNVVQGWHAPGTDGTPDDVRDPSTIMLVDDTAGDLYLLVEPTRLAVMPLPESRPDLPNPGDRVPPGPPGTGGGCDGLC